MQQRVLLIIKPKATLNNPQTIEAIQLQTMQQTIQQPFKPKSSPIDSLHQRPKEHSTLSPLS